MFSRLLGVHVQRLATIAHGDGVCTTHIPAGPASHPRSASPAGAQHEELPHEEHPHDDAPHENSPHDLDMTTPEERPAP
jgi:hypothetical protein